MLTTTNYDFKKPSSTEVLNMDYINEDMEAIDQTLKGLDDEIKEHSSNLSHIPYAVSTGSANAYEVSIAPAPTAYLDGMAVCVKINATSTGSSTLNVNGLGTKIIKDCYGNDITSDSLKANTPYIMRYESVSQSFIVQGKGGGGNATADQILNGVKATVDSGPIVGTMPNNGAVVIKPSINNQVISEGYHDGNGYVEGDADLIPDNIKSGVSIFGVEGKSSIIETSDGTASESEILDGYTAYVDGAKVTGAMPNNGSVSELLDINGTYTIPKGYHDGTGKVTQSIPTKEAATYTPGATDQTIDSGQYLSGVQTILGDSNLVTDNIKAGTSIFGVTGKASVVDTEDATAGAGDVLSGKTVYINGAKTTGTMANNGAISQSLPINGSYTIPAGYHNGSGKIIQSIPVKSANTIMPGTTDQVISAGQYLGGDQLIKGDSNLLASNIVSGKSIFGVNGNANVQSMGGRRYATGTFNYTPNTGSIYSPSTFNFPFAASIVFLTSVSNTVSHYTFYYVWTPNNKNGVYAVIGDTVDYAAGASGTSTTLTFSSSLHTTLTYQIWE